MKNDLYTERGFTLVEIMIVVVIIGLLAAMAIPAFQKVRQNAYRGVLRNDARQLAGAAQQYMVEYNLTSVEVTYHADTGLIGGDLSPYVTRIAPGTTGSSPLVMDQTFTLSNPLRGVESTFTSEGQEVSP